MPIWNCAARVGLKGKVNIFTVASAPAREFFGSITHIFLYEKQGLVHLSLEEVEDSIKVNLFKKNKRTKNGILRKVSFTIPGNTETGQRFRGLAGRNSIGRLQYDGQNLYIYPEAMIV